MTSTTARIKREGKHFEVLVDMNEALKFKKGKGGSVILEIDKIFYNIKKGDIVSQEDLNKIFKTTNIQAIAEKIVRDGEVEESQEHRDEEQEAKFRQVVDFLSKNAIDPKSGNPITPERIKNALNQSGMNIKKIPVEEQINEIIEKIGKIIPIRIETKKVKIQIPAQFTGQIYGLVSKYKEAEDWNNDGSLDVKVSVPAGLILDFYDKLNSVTHGSAITEEIK